MQEFNEIVLKDEEHCNIYLLTHERKKTEKETRPHYAFMHQNFGFDRLMQEIKTTTMRRAATTVDMQPRHCQQQIPNHVKQKLGICSLSTKTWYCQQAFEGCRKTDLNLSIEVLTESWIHLTGRLHLSIDSSIQAFSILNRSMFSILIRILICFVFLFV